MHHPDTVSYRGFLNRSAEELSAVPENAHSLLTGFALLRLGPFLFEKVRQGQHHVDNGSVDGSAEFLKESHQSGAISKVVLLRENQGISAGYNHGFAVADRRSDYVMKLDSDIIVVSPDWLARVIDLLSNNEDVVLTLENPCVSRR